MKTPLDRLALLLAVVLLPACIVRTAGACPPAHHWEGGRCVHNGDGRGNGNGRGHGSDDDHHGGGGEQRGHRDDHRGRGH